MNLNFISSEILKPYEYDKHYGLFVYLMNDYEEYAYGLYFGGINGWERLTNDFYSTKNKVNAPIPSTKEYTYNGTSQSYYPENWKEIEGLTSIFNYTAIDAGTYNVEVSLTDTDRYQWADTGKTETKILNWTINPYHLESNQIKANLNKYEMSYGDAEPYVSSVICSHVFLPDGSFEESVLSENTDYIVTKPDNFNVGTKQFKVSLTGVFGKNYTCDDIYLDVKVNKKKIALPTNLNQTVEYDSDNIKVYNPKPDNWSAISSYCTITGEKDVKNVGTYTYTISLNDNTNYCWSDETSDDKTLTFVISTEGVEVPDWSNLNTNYEYQTSFKTTPISLNPKNYTNIVENVVVNGDRNISLPGTYKIIISLEDSVNQNWNDGTKSPKEFEVEISYHEVAHPTFTSVLTYNGSEQTYLPSNWSSISGDCTISGNKQTNAGTYDYTVSLNDKDGFIWDDTKNDTDKSGEWNINKAIIAVPTKSNVTYTYNGSEQTWLPGNWSSISDACSISGNKQTNADTYTALVSLNDKANYNWTDNTSSTKEFTWVINTLANSSAILEANGTDLTKDSDGHYVMTYNPTNHPNVKVTSITGNVLTEGTDYDVTYPTSYNASATEYQYTITMKGNYSGTYNLYLKVNKANGYFISGPSIIGELKYGNTISVIAEPVENAAMTYKWYSDVEQLTEAGKGDEESETSNSIKLEYTDYYYGIVVHAAETDNYLAHDGYVYTKSSVGKGEYAFSLNSHEGKTIFTENGKYAIPGNNKKIDDDGEVTYTSSDETVAIISNGNIVMKSVGTVTITATISNSNTYNYTNDTDTFVLTITEEADCYWGYTQEWDVDKNGREKLKTTLSLGILPTNKITASMTNNGDGTESFTLSSSEYVKMHNSDSDKYPNYCNIYWFAIPTTNTLVAFLEDGEDKFDVNDVEEKFKVKNNDVFDNDNSDSLVINVNDTDYYVYSLKSSAATLAGTGYVSHELKITIK